MKDINVCLSSEIKCNQVTAKTCRPKQIYSSSSYEKNCFDPNGTSTLKLNDTNHCFILGCYDCNYAPSGYVKGFKDWAEGLKEVGYMRCALTSPADRFFLSKRLCLSGLCYIRQEENGSK